MLVQGGPYGLECVNGVEEPASVSGYEGGTKGLSLTLYVVQGKNNYFSKVQVFRNALLLISKLISLILWLWLTLTEIDSVHLKPTH